MTADVTLRLADFEGHWTVQRRITDHRAGSTGWFEGTARFQPDGEELIYSETGLLHLPGQPAFRAERRYLWANNGPLLQVSFEDGRPFHSFDPANPDATHWCDPDTYAVRYDFAEWPVWHSTWDVSGPSKAYQMVTTYTRTPS